jgi:hypothetical protein
MSSVKIPVKLHYYILKYIPIDTFQSAHNYFLRFENQIQIYDSFGNKVHQYPE